MCTVCSSRSRFTSIWGGWRAAGLLIALTTVLLLAFAGSAFATGTFSGIVTYQSSASPVAYPNVVWYRWNAGSGRWDYENQTMGDVNGVYTAVAAPGKYRVRFEDASGIGAFEYYPDANDLGVASDVMVEEGIDTPAINAALEAAGGVSGTVTNYGDSPLQDIEVTAYQYTVTGMATQWIPVSAASTQGNGGYTLGGLRAGIYRLRFMDFTNVYSTVYYDEARSLETALDVPVTTGVFASGVGARMAEAATVSGTVAEDGTGDPLQGMFVAAYIFIDDGGAGSWQRVNGRYTATDGTYSMNGLEPGQYRMQFSGGGHVTEWWDDQLVESEATTLSLSIGQNRSDLNASLALKPVAGQISGRVTSARTSLGLAGVFVSAFYYNQDAGEWAAYGNSATTGADGGYTITGLMPDTYKILFNPANVPPYHSQYYDRAIDLDSATLVPLTSGESVGPINAALDYPNTSPVAVADSYTTAEDTPKVVPAAGVLANDSDVDGQSLSAVKVTNPSNGTVTLNANGSFTYAPYTDYNGTDSFTYKANDGQADSNTVTVTITVTPVNDVPQFFSGDDSAVDQDSGAYSAAWASGIHAGAPNESGQLLNFATVASDPSLFSVQPAVALDGTLTFTPAPAAIGSSSVSVTLTDDGTAGGPALSTEPAVFTITVRALEPIVPSLTLEAPAVSAYGSAGLTGELTDDAATGLSGKTISIQRQTGTTWEEVGTALTGSNGSYSYTASPTVKTLYRAFFAADALYTNQLSAEKTVLPRVDLTAPAATASQTFGTAYAVSGYLKPRHTAGTAPVMIQAFHYEKKSDGSFDYVYKSAYPATASDYSTHSKYLASIKLSPAGKWRLRAYHAADSLNAATYSGYTDAMVNDTALSLSAPSVSPYASAKLTGYLKAAGATGLLTPVSGGSISVQILSSGIWKTIGTVPTSSTGYFTYTAKPTKKTTYRVMYAGGGGYLGKTSVTKTVLPRVYVTRPSFGRTTLAYGKTYKAIGYLKPRHKAYSYPVKIYAYRYSSGKYRYVKTYSAKAFNYSSYTKYVRSIKLPSKGKWRLRTVHAADSLNAKTYSSYRYVTVK